MDSMWTYNDTSSRYIKHGPSEITKLVSNNKRHLKEEYDVQLAYMSYSYAILLHSEAVRLFEFQKKETTQKTSQLNFYVKCHSFDAMIKAKVIYDIEYAKLEQKYEKEQAFCKITKNKLETAKDHDVFNTVIKKEKIETVKNHDMFITLTKEEKNEALMTLSMSLYQQFIKTQTCE